jgi:threonine dehydratase
VHRPAINLPGAADIVLSEELVQDAIAYLDGRIRRTPVEFSPALSAIVGAPIWLKLEFLQITGSFKLRGVLFRMARLTRRREIMARLSPMWRKS